MLLTVITSGQTKALPGSRAQKWKLVRKMVFFAHGIQTLQIRQDHVGLCFYAITVEDPPSCDFLEIAQKRTKLGFSEVS